MNEDLLKFKYNACTHVGVETETRSHTNGEVGEETHKGGGEARNCSSRGDKVIPNFSQTDVVGIVGQAKVTRWANASSSRVGEDGGVDGNLQACRSAVCRDVAV